MKTQLRLGLVTCTALSLVACASNAPLGTAACGAGFLDNMPATGTPTGVTKTFDLNGIRCAEPKALDLAAQFAETAPAPELKPAYKRLYIEGERNAVLNFQRVALMAMSLELWDLAEKALDQALLRIDTIYADNEQARQARSVFSAERVKDFKGEPYERAMAYYYRGLLYAARGDFQNARAMFMQAYYQDTQSESETYAGDFGLMPMLAGWASACDGNHALAKDFQERAWQVDQGVRGLDPAKPLLMIFESGRVPYKKNTGTHGESLTWSYHPATASEPSASACVVPVVAERKVAAAVPPVKRPARQARTRKAAAAKPVQPVVSRPASAPAPICVDQFMRAADLGLQATTRGGRAIDAVLQGKASFKDGAKGVSDVAQTVSTVALVSAVHTGNQDMANLGLAGLFIGLAAQIAEQKAQTKADIREWEQLPQHLWLGQLAVQTQVKSVKLGENTLTLLGGHNAAASCKVYWGREHPATTIFYEAGPIEPSRDVRDENFRAGLVALLQGVAL